MMHHGITSRFLIRVACADLCIVCLPLLLGLGLSGCQPADSEPVKPVRATTLAEAMASPDSIRNLDLFYRRLDGFPPDILKLKRLEHLTLRTCTIGSLPDEITTLTHLSRLDLGQTALTNLTPAVGQLTNLTYLWLNDNTLTTLPGEIGRLSKLLYLNADRNQVTSLPPEFGLLPSLKWVRLNNNHLTSLPPDLSGLAKTLEVLYLMGNPIPEAERNRIRKALPNCRVID